MVQRRFAFFRLAAGLGIGLFVFYIYSHPYLMLGLIFGAGLGISTYSLLGTWKIHKFRTRLIAALTFVTWIGAFSLLIQMNPDSFMRYLTSHLNAYELRMFSSEFVHVPFVRQLPNTLGSTILMQLSLPWAEITVPHPVERLLFLMVPFHYPPVTLGMFIFVLLPHLVLVLLFGRGWCGWVCYFGNQTEAIATRGRDRWRLQRFRDEFKTSDGRILIDGVKKEVRYIKYLFMVLLLLPSFLLGINTICTLGFIFRFQYPFSALLIFLMLFFTGIVLPLKTRKRWWCLLCPAGAGIALVESITPFKISVDTSNCDRCYSCSNVCPMHAISPQTFSIKKEPNLDCVKCCRCIEACPQGAVDVYVRRTRRRVRGLFTSLIVVATASWYVWFAVSSIELFKIVF